MSDFNQLEADLTVVDRGNPIEQPIGSSVDHGHRATLHHRFQLEAFYQSPELVDQPGFRLFWVFGRISL